MSQQADSSGAWTSQNGATMNDDLAAAFHALGDELRVEIIRALCAVRQESPEDPGLTFSELSRRVGAEDTGLFNYHLKQLRGRFVQQQDGRYRLTVPGLMVAGSILTGELDSGIIEREVTLDDPCSHCDGEVCVSYHDGWLTATCSDEGTLLTTSVPPRVVEDEGIERAIRFATTKTLQWMEIASIGRCPICFGAVETSLVEEEIHGQPVVIKQACETCGTQLRHPPGMYIAIQPAVRSIYTECDRPIMTQKLWDLELFRPELFDITDTDPLRIEVSTSIDRYTVSAAIHEDGTIHGLSTELDQGCVGERSD